MDTWRPRQVTLLLSVLLCMLLLASVKAEELRNAQAHPGPITIESQVQLPEESEAASLDAIWLAGFGTHSDGPPTALSLVWAEKVGLFPVWSLQLQSDADLLPTDVRLERGSGVLAGTHVFTVPSIGKPRWGHVYHSVLSYDPTTGALSLWIHDATAGETLFAGEYGAGQASDPLYASAGVRRDGVYDRLDTLEATAGYTPRGVQWRVSELTGGGVGTIEFTRVDRSLVEQVGIAIDLKNPVDGTFHVTSVSQGTSHELARLQGPQGSTVVAIPKEHLTPGRVELVLEYVDVQGSRRFSERKELEVGYLRAEFEPTVFDGETKRVQSAVTLQADGPLTTSLRIDAKLTRLMWDPVARTYVEEVLGTVPVLDTLLELDGQPRYVPLDVTVPDLEPALWSIEFQVWPSVSVPLVASGTDRLFTTYESPTGLEEGPFTLVVLPDTQYQTHVSPQGGNPLIFTRMIHWIAEHASSRNIGLVLHVGDVTDHNAPNQWEVAQNSLYLLDGVVPYTLTVGNHDIGLGGNAATRDTWLNTYFPVERIASKPWFGGTFEEGRLENSFQTFRLGGQEYLVLSLEFLPRDEVLQWANEVVGAHPSHKVILVTHTYTSIAGSQRSVYGDRYGIVDSPASTVNTGVDIWERLVRGHANMSMVFSGHVTPDGTVPRQVKIGDHGNRVYEMLINFQHRTRGGDGWLALLHFTPESHLVGVELFSPYLDAYRSDISGAFGVPFCIDLDSVYYVPVNEACPALPQRDTVRTSW